MVLLLFRYQLDIPIFPSLPCSSTNNFITKARAKRGRNGSANIFSENSEFSYYFCYLIIFINLYLCMYVSYIFRFSLPIFFVSLELLTRTVEIWQTMYMFMKMIILVLVELTLFLKDWLCVLFLRYLKYPVTKSDTILLTTFSKIPVHQGYPFISTNQPLLISFSIAFPNFSSRVRILLFFSATQVFNQAKIDRSLIFISSKKNIQPSGFLQQFLYYFGFNRLVPDLGHGVLNRW